jgi:hypothetical protein
LDAIPKKTTESHRNRGRARVGEGSDYCLPGHAEGEDASAKPMTIAPQSDLPDCSYVLVALDQMNFIRET